MTEIENFQKLMHLNQFSCQKHTHACVWVILLQLPGAWLLWVSSPGSPLEACAWRGDAGVTTWHILVLNLMSVSN
jgi:hypothetical protein